LPGLVFPPKQIPPQAFESQILEVARSLAQMVQMEGVPGSLSTRGVPGCESAVATTPRKTHGTHGAHRYHLKIFTFSLCASMQITALIFAFFADFTGLP